MDTYVLGDLGFHEVDDLSVSDEVVLSDRALLALALEDAVDARRAGVLVGPAVDETALRRAQRRALRADTARALRLAGRVSGGAA